MKAHSIKLLWMYPDLMNTYGDRGNVIALTKRCEWRGISIQVVYHSIGNEEDEIEKSDIVFMGGAQDRQQHLVSKDLLSKKKALLNSIEKGTPSLFICGAYQFFGKYYKASDGKKIPGLGIFDCFTVHAGATNKRLIGNIILQWKGATLVGFENHGGRTFLGNKAVPFAQVIKGYGNNDIDKTEGIKKNNAIGSYLHGPLLPKNPALSDFLIKKALENKYGSKVQLGKLKDNEETKAHEFVEQNR